jgi:hypothetical protein
MLSHPKKDVAERFERAARRELNRHYPNRHHLSEKDQK